MTVVCAWCQKVLRAGSPPTSHGICSSCAKDFEIGVASELTANGREAAPVTVRTTA